MLYRIIVIQFRIIFFCVSIVENTWRFRRFWKARNGKPFSFNACERTWYYGSSTGYYSST